jgi:hypothetical protein
VFGEFTHTQFVTGHHYIIIKTYSEPSKKATTGLFSCREKSFRKPVHKQ